MYVQVHIYVTNFYKKYSYMYHVKYFGVILLYLSRYLLASLFLEPPVMESYGTCVHGPMLIIMVAIMVVGFSIVIIDYGY